MGGFTVHAFTFVFQLIRWSITTVTVYIHLHMLFDITLMFTWFTIFTAQHIYYKSYILSPWWLRILRIFLLPRWVLRNSFTPVPEMEGKQRRPVLKWRGWAVSNPGLHPINWSHLNFHLRTWSEHSRANIKEKMHFHNLSCMSWFHTTLLFFGSEFAPRQSNWWFEPKGPKMWDDLQVFVRCFPQ